MSSARDFTRLQFDWLRQVQDDPEMSHAAFALAFAICDHINARSMTAWPTQETLANILHIDPRTVRRLASELSGRGHLTIQVRRGRHVSNVYRLVIKNRTAVSGYEGEKEDIHVRLSEAKTGHLRSENRTSVSEKPDTHVLQNTSRNTLKEHSSEQARDAGASVSSLDENPKAILFGDGLTWLAQKTGRSPAVLRTAIGQMLKVARDDAGHVLAVVRQARREDRADPISWTMAVLRARQHGVPQQPNGAKAPANIPAGMILSKAAARA